MRLSSESKTAIKSIIHQHFPEAEIRLFGSRTDDSKKGGDIDLLVLTQQPGDNALKRKILLQLEDALGEQKIDLMLATTAKESTFVEHIFSQSEVL